LRGLAQTRSLLKFDIAGFHEMMGLLGKADRGLIAAA
jgi:hypothetical protein